MGPEVPCEEWYLLSHHPFCGSGRNHAKEAPAERSLGWLQTPTSGVLAWDFLSPGKRASETSPPIFPTVHGHPLRPSPLCAANTHLAVRLVPVSLLSEQLCFSLQEFPQSGNGLPPRITALPLASHLRHSQWITVRQNSQEALASSFVRNFGWIPSKSDKIWVAGPCVTSKGLKRQQPMYCLLRNVLLF